MQLIHKVIEYGSKQSHLNDNFGTQEAVIQITKRIFKVRTPRERIKIVLFYQYG